MNISDIINKSSPLYKQKEMSKSEYKKLVDRNTELIDKLKELEEKYNIMKENAETLAKRIDKAVEYINHYQNYGKEKTTYINGDSLLNILKGSDKDGR